MAAPRTFGKDQIVTTVFAFGNTVEQFWSYGTLIAEKVHGENGTTVWLSSQYWNYSKTTSKYRNQFLLENLADTRKKIKSGEYKVMRSSRTTEHLFVDMTAMNGSEA